MDCVEGALRNSFVPETPLKMTQNQTFGDDLSAAGAGQNGVSGDDFFVDDLLDFSNGFVEGEGEEEEGKNQGGEDISVQKPCSVSISVSPLKKTEIDDKDKVTISVKEDFASLPVSEISVPTDDLDSLEWLSHFVEDSFSGYSLAYPAGKLPVEKKTGDGEIPVEEKKPCFATPVQTKARTKRGRTSVRVWPACSGSLTDSSSSSTSSSSTTTMSSSPTASWFLYPTPVHSAESPGKPLAKKLKKKPAPHGGNGPQQPRHPTMASRSNGCKNSLQCLWCSVQIWSAATGVPSGMQPNVFHRVALKQSPESSGDAAEEGIRRNRFSSAGSEFLKIFYLLFREFYF